MSRIVQVGRGIRNDFIVIMAMVATKLLVTSFVYFASLCVNNSTANITLH